MKNKWKLKDRKRGRTKETRGGKKKREKGGMLQQIRTTFE